MESQFHQNDISAESLHQLSGTEYELSNMGENMPQELSIPVSSQPKKGKTKTKYSSRITNRLRRFVGLKSKSKKSIEEDLKKMTLPSSDFPVVPALRKQKSRKLISAPPPTRQSTPILPNSSFGTQDQSDIKFKANSKTEKEKKLAKKKVSKESLTSNHSIYMTSSIKFPKQKSKLQKKLIKLTSVMNAPLINKNKIQHLFPLNLGDYKRVIEQYFDYFTLLGTETNNSILKNFLFIIEKFHPDPTYYTFNESSNIKPIVPIWWPYNITRHSFSDLSISNLDYASVDNKIKLLTSILSNLNFPATALFVFGVNLAGLNSLDLRNNLEKSYAKMKILSELFWFCIMERQYRVRVKLFNAKLGIPVNTPMEIFSESYGSNSFEPVDIPALKKVNTGDYIHVSDLKVNLKNSLNDQTLEFDAFLKRFDLSFANNTEGFQLFDSFTDCKRFIVNQTQELQLRIISARLQDKIKVDHNGNFIDKEQLIFGIEEEAEDLYQFWLRSYKSPSDLNYKILYGPNYSKRKLINYRNVKRLQNYDRRKAYNGNIRVPTNIMVPHSAEIHSTLDPYSEFFINGSLDGMIRRERTNWSTISARDMISSNKIYSRQMGQATRVNSLLFGNNVDESSSRQQINENLRDFQVEEYLSLVFT